LLNLSAEICGFNLRKSAGKMGLGDLEKGTWGKETWKVEKPKFEVVCSLWLKKEAHRQIFLLPLVGQSKIYWIY